MSVIYMNETVSLLFSRENKEKIEELINSGEVKIIEREGKEAIKYLKVTDE